MRGDLGETIVRGARSAPKKQRQPAKGSAVHAPRQLMGYQGQSPWLVGSHAERRTHRESDVDIGILVDRDAYPTRAARFDVRVRLITCLTAALAPAEPDVVVLNDAPPSRGTSQVEML